jgi:hypothetical protein
MSFGAAVVAGVAQFGVVLGLGIIIWSPHSPANADIAWRNLLAWLVFIVAVAVFSGGAMARRHVGRAGTRPASARGAVILATAAAVVGAAGLFPFVLAQSLAAHPARPHPVLMLALAAGAGAVVGAIACYAALRSRAIAVAVGVSAGWAWLTALITATAGLLRDGSAVRARLGILDLPVVSAHTGWWFDPATTVGVAVVLAAVVATMSRRAGAARLGVALSGLAGPGLLSAGYVVAGPSLDAIGERPLDPYVAWLLACIAGLLIATTVAVLPRRQPRPAAPAPTPPRQRPAPIGAGPHLAIEAAPAPAAGAAPTPVVATAAVLTTKAPTTKAPTTKVVAPAAPSSGCAFTEPPTTVLTVPPPVVPTPPARPAANPAAPKPAAPKPANGAPPPVPAAATKPPATKPPATKPTTTKPTTAKPAATKPAATKPVTVAPATGTPTTGTPATAKPTASAAPAAPPAPAEPQPTGDDRSTMRAKGRGRGDDGKPLRKHEREHVAWIETLVNLPNNPDLNLRRRP